MKKLTPGRVAALLTALAGAATAVAVPLADLDTESVAGVLGGLAAISVAFERWLKGWREWERHQAGAPAAMHMGEPYRDLHPDPAGPADDLDYDKSQEHPHGG